MVNDRQSNPRPLNCSGLHAVDIEPPMRCIPVLLAAAACLAMVEGASAQCALRWGGGGCGDALGVLVRPWGSRFHSTAENVFEKHINKKTEWMVLKCRGHKSF